MTAVDILARTLPSLLLIVGGLLVLRLWAQRGRLGPQSGVRVVSRTGLAKGAVVAVVAVGERRLLVGASEHGICLLSELAAETDAVPAADDPLGPALPDGPVAARPAGIPGLTLPGLRPRTLPWTIDRPRMAPVDRLRALTVRRTVPSHPRRPTGVLPRT